jgi:glycosyltransferase involved in cell wall biosynthesis
MKICLDLTCNEMMDRHGGFGRYAFRLLEHLLALPPEALRGHELYALPSSGALPVRAHVGLVEQVLARPVLPAWRHKLQRRFALPAALRLGRIGLFHSTQPSTLPRLTGCPVIATTYDIIPVVFPRQDDRVGLWFRADQALDGLKCARRHRAADHLIAISEATRQDVIHTFGIAPDKISTVHLGVDMNRFRPMDDGDRAAERQALAARHDLPQRWFISVGSDHYRKNQGRLLEAWRRAAPSIPEGLALVGKSLYDDTFQSIMAAIHADGLTERVRWLDGISDDELPALYRGATALIAPSLYEGFGLTLVEGMASGTPVAAAQATSYPEVGGEAVDYFDPCSVEQIHAAMIRLSEDAEHRAELRRRGLERVQRFSWAETARQTLAVYLRVLEGQ